MPRSKWLTTLGAGAALAAAAAAVELPTQRTKAPYLPGIPGEADYRWPATRLSQPVTAQSFLAVTVKNQLNPLGRPVPLALPTTTGAPELLLPDPPPRPPEMRYFQMSVARLDNDHCSLSRVVAFAERDGTLTVTFRADQNPVQTGSPNDLKPPSTTGVPVLLTKQLEHLKRNEFHVRLRFLAAAGNVENQPRIDPGRPVMAEICVPPFWVQKGQPCSLNMKFQSKDLADWYGIIDRMEVQFQYR